MVVSTLQVFFFESERSRLLDQRLETMASSLIASGLSMELIENLSSTDDLINDLLGEEKIDQIITIYSVDGKILAQNVTATELPLPFTPKDHWQTYEVNGRTIRALNLPTGNLVIQVGLILNFTLERWNWINSRMFTFIFTIFVVLLIAAYFSTQILFNPLKKLSAELETMSNQLDRKLGQPLNGFAIGAEVARLAKGPRATKDEFEIFCNHLENFLKKLEDYTKSFNAQTAILTHELKTPLTIVKNYLQEARLAQDPVRAQDLVSGALVEIDRLALMISDYLRWSVLMSNPADPELYAVKLSEVVQRVVSHLNLSHGNRIKIEGQSDATIFAMPEHVQQLLSNLLMNALNYSPKEKPVICRVQKNALSIEDQGPGLPETVLKHLGSPFNRGNSKATTERGSGLGLAWVNSLCQKYQWEMNVNSTPQGTQIIVHLE